MTSLSAATIAKLFLLQHPADNPDAVPEMFKQIYCTIAPHVKSSDVPWGLVLPEHLAENFSKHLKIFQDRLELLRVNSSYLLDVFGPTQEVLFDDLGAFKPAKISRSLFEQYAKEDNTKVVASFEPASDGYALDTRYSRVSSVTGRLTVEQGPNILNLKKRYRNMIESRWGSNGAILGLDYQALEPTLLVALNKSGFFSPSHVPATTRDRIGDWFWGLLERNTKRDCKREKLIQNIGTGDPYLEIIQKAGLEGAVVCQENGSNNQLRSIVKEITVSRMNGMQDDGLVRKIKSSLRRSAAITAEELVEQVDNTLDLSNVFNNLYSQWTNENSCQFIVNFFGRPISCDSDANLINRYFQSSAVDLAMMGFKNIVSYLRNDMPDPEEFAAKTGAPLFLLHDMIVFDVNVAHGSSGLTAINSLAKIGSNGLFGFEDGSFKLRQSPFIQPSRKQT